MTLTASFSFTASGSQTKDDLLAVVTDSFSSGNATFPSMSASFTLGSNAGQASKWYRGQRTLAGNATDLVSLTGTLTDSFGSTISFTKIKSLLVAIIDPDGTKKIKVGPQNETDAWQGFFGGVGTESYVETSNWLHFVDHLGTGWTVSQGTADVLPISNSGANSLQYILWILGN
jgi:hypothetical protein